MLFALALTSVQPALAQPITIPNFWDPNERFVRPDLSALPRLKFLTTTDFPPFNFIDRRKRLTGFHVDLARAICVELDMLAKCQIQAVPWERLDRAMEAGEGDAIIAGLELTPETRSKYGFTRPYLHIPGRFVTRRDTGLKEPLYEALFKKRVGVVEGSAHAVFFGENFSGRTARPYPTRQSAFNALKAGEVDAVFTDGLSASFWLVSATADNCCVFAGGPYLSPRHFGHGMAIAVAKDDGELLNGLNFALKAIGDKGVFKELYLKYFPAGLF